MRKKFIAAVLCALLTVVFAFAACTPGSSDENEYTLEREPGTKQVTIYYNRAEGYSDCDIWFCILANTAQRLLSMFPKA